jgi:hypothetical protein
MKKAGNVARWLAPLAVFASVNAEACHSEIHYTKAQIDAADLRLYEHDVKMRDLNTGKFDLLHAPVGTLLGSEQVYEKEWDERKKHPGLFAREHHHLWRILEGDHLYHEKHPYTSPQELGPPSSIPVGPEVPGPTGPVGPGPGKPGNTILPASVPEPASGALMLVATAVGLVAASRRRRSRKPRS